MEERDVVAPAAGLERVPGRSRGRGRSVVRRPHMTTPPPRLRRRTSTLHDARGAPELELALERVRLPEGADRGAEEVADLAPAVPQRASGEREPGAYVELPGRAARCPRARRTRATRRFRPGRTTRASSRKRPRWVVDVAQEVRERQMVEGRVREGQRLGGRLDELDAIAEALARAPASISGLWSTP